MRGRLTNERKQQLKDRGPAPSLRPAGLRAIALKTPQLGTRVLAGAVPAWRTSAVDRQGPNHLQGRCGEGGKAVVLPQKTASRKARSGDGGYGIAEKAKADP